MDISLVTQYSLWWILPIVLCALAIVYWLYFNKTNKYNELKKWQLFLLASLRFVVLFLLLLLLIGPRIKYEKKIENKPILIFAQDNSESIRLGKDSSYYLNQYSSEMASLINDLKQDYDVKLLGFGDKVSNLTEFDYRESSTDFSFLFENIRNNYGSLENVQLLLASDGIYNSGSNPRYLVQDLGVPIHCVQLGDTTVMTDVSIYSLRSNGIGFTNSKLPVKIGVKALQSKGEKLKLQVRNQSILILEEDINVNSDNFYQEKDYLIDAKEKGLQKFAVEIKSEINEYSQKNNTSEFVVDVLDSKRKIAICFDVFHPDIAVIRSAIMANSNFVCELNDLSKKNPKLDETNLLILYQLPSIDNDYKDLFRRIELANIPCLFVVGGNSNLENLGSLNAGVSFDNRNNYYQDAVYLENDDFALFNLQSKNRKIFEKLPPLLAPFGDIKFESEYNVLAYQSIKGIETQYPLIAFTSQNDRKLGWIFGEGVWRWKLNEVHLFESNRNFYDLINRVVQYLALTEKKEQLVVKHQKDYIEGSQLRIEAELYNKSYQLTNNEALKFVLTDKDGKSYNYQFNRSDRDYELTINYLKSGRYRFKAETIGLDANISKTGEFIVRKDNIESKRLQADPIVLKQMSVNSGGQYFKRFQAGEIRDYLLNDSNKKTVISFETNYGNAVDFVYLLSFIIILMILEWFLRKYWLGN